MKFFIAFALIAAVASAAYIKPTQVNSEIAQIVAAIQSPSTDPATAAALEALLLDVMGVSPSPIAVGPAIVETSPIAVGPTLIDFPLPDGGAVTAEDPTIVNPAPAVVESVADSSPLVQIIVNVNQASAGSSPIAVGPAIIDQIAEEVYVPGPVSVVDSVIIPGPVVAPVQVVEPAVPLPIVPGPVNVIDNVVVEPIQVVEPIVVSPVIVGTPIIPAPAVVLPDELN